MRQKKNTWFYIGGSGLDRTDDFQKFYGSGLDRIQFYWIRTGHGLKNFAVRSSLVSSSWLAVSLHNSWTDQASKPVKTSLDPRDSKDSNENDANLPFHLKFVKKSLFVHLPHWNFNKIRGKCEKTHTASSLTDPVFALRWLSEYSTTACFRKKLIWALSREKFGCPKV